MAILKLTSLVFSVVAALVALCVLGLILSEIGQKRKGILADPLVFWMVVSLCGTSIVSSCLVSLLMMGLK